MAFLTPVSSWPPPVVGFCTVNNDMGEGKDTGTGWAVALMSLMFIPVVLFFLVMGLNKALNLHLHCRS